MIHDVLMWWWAVGCILLTMVALHRRFYDLADLEDVPQLKALPNWALIVMFWAIAMVTAFVWPWIVVRVAKRMRRQS